MNENPSYDRKKSPQLRIAITPYCNVNPPCVYCRPGGEGYHENLNERMTREEIKQIVSICAEVGITYVKFTGGEPLLREDIIDIISDIRSLGTIKDLQLVTNGILLAGFAHQLKNTGLTSITVSIDTVNEANYEKIKHTKLKLIIEGLKKCREAGLPVVINSLIRRSNKNDLPGLIKLAEETGAKLKLLNLMDTKGDAAFFKAEFYDFAILRRKFFDKISVYKGYEEAPGKVGAPLFKYILPSGLQVLLYDFNLGACYDYTCFNCRYYPCQDALISLKLTHDGHLKRCLIRNDNLVDILHPLRKGDFRKVKKSIQKSFNISTRAKYYPDVGAMLKKGIKW